MPDLIFIAYMAFLAVWIVVGLYHSWRLRHPKDDETK